MTEEEIIKYAEYAKYPFKFIQDFNFGFNSDSHRKENLSLDEFDINIISHLYDNKLSIIKKSRQMHVSHLIAMYAAWHLIFRFDFSIAWISENVASSIRILENIREILENCPKYIFDWDANVVVNNKKEIRLSNGSSIKAIAANPSAGRGYAFHMVIIDEAASISESNMKAIWLSVVMPCMGFKNNKIIIASTPAYVDFFYKIWEGGITNKQGFAPLHLDWTMNPRWTKDAEMRDGELWSPWYEKMCETLNHDESLIRRELWAEFSANIKPSSLRVNFRIDAELYEKMTNKIGDKSVSDYLRDLIKKDLEI